MLFCGGPLDDRPGLTDYCFAGLVSSLRELDASKGPADAYKMINAYILSKVLHLVVALKENPKLTPAQFIVEQQNGNSRVGNQIRNTVTEWALQQTPGYVANMINSQLTILKTNRVPVSFTVDEATSIDLLFRGVYVSLYLSL